MKKCTCCQIEKSLESFAKKRNGHNTRCRDCTKTYMQQLYLRKKSEIKAKHKMWYEKNREKAIASVRRNYAENREKINFQRMESKYGLTKEGFEMLLAAQNGKCAVCQNDNGGKRLAVDHNHETGAVRALLCDQCNTALGLLKECPKRMNSLISYVAKYQK